MAAGDSHQGTLTWVTTTPLLDQKCTGTVAYTDSWSKRGLQCSIAINSATNVAQYTLVATGTAVAQGSGNLSSQGAWVFESDDIALFDANSPVRLLSEQGHLVMAGNGTSSYIFGRFSIVGAGIFELPQAFGAQNASGFQFGFEEQ